MSKHHADDRFVDDLAQQLAYDAMINACVTGSVGSTSTREYRNLDGVLEVQGEQTVERIAVPVGRIGTRSSCAWRVVGSDSNDDIVIVASRIPGRSTSHAIDNDLVDA